MACDAAAGFREAFARFRVGRLRAERERRKITLESIAANTNIRAGLLSDLEKGDVSRWPSGIFRRSFVRAYGITPHRYLTGRRVDRALATLRSYSVIFSNKSVISC